MLDAAKQCERIKDDIHDNGVKPLNEHWPDHVGTLAAGTLKRIGERSEVTSILARATVDPLDTLNHAVTTAQHELQAGIDVATQNGLAVDLSTGQVTVPRSDSGDVLDILAKADAQRRAQKLINDAVEAATQADRLCSEALNDVATKNPDTTSVEQAQAVQSTNTARALEELRDTIPDGLTPDEVAQWWGSLTPQQQTDLIRACPLELYDLKGIPQSVQRQIDRPENGYSTVAALRYARDHWNDKSIDTYNNNCTNFVSHALHAGGLPYKSGWKPLRYDNDSWGASPYGELDIHDGAEGWDHSKSWGFAPAQKDFFLRHGASVSTTANAQAGDVAYFEYANSGDAEGAYRTAGEAHHAALVTGVLPDGQVLYTQHTTNAQNLPLQGRLPEVAQDAGQQHVEFVRPKATW